MVEFASEQDRDFYVTEDQVHAAFGKRLTLASEGGVEGIMVIDFSH